MNPTSSNTSSADPEIQRQYAEQQSQSEQQPPPAQGPRMVQRNPQQQDEVRDETYAADGDTHPSQSTLEAGPDVRVVARSDATAVTPSTAEPAVPLTRKALNKAICSNDLETINHLLKSGSIDLNIFDEVHKLPLAVAAREGNSDVVRLLLQSGAEVNAITHMNEPVLMIAAGLGHFDVVKLLIEAGANIHEVDTQKKLLHLATRGGNTAMVEMLLSLKFDVNAADTSGRTPLMTAAWAGHVGVFTLLLEKKAAIDKPDHTDHTLLMYAVRGGNEAIVQKLLSLGVDADVVDRDGMTALMIAVKNRPWDRENRLLDIIKVLLNHGADVNLRGTKVENATVRAIKQDDIPVLELLLAYGGEPDDLQKELSPLMVDMLRHRVLLKSEVVVTALMLESLYGTSLSALPEISVDKTVHEELAQLSEGLKVCSPITMALDNQLKSAGKQIQALADTGKKLSQAQKSMLIAGLLVSLDGWVASWPKEDWTPYKWKYLSAQGEAKLTALVKLQAEKLVVLGEQVEEKLAAGLETLLLQCTQYTQVKNGELVVDEVGLMAHLTGQLGLYGPLADQVAAAWFTTVNQQQPIIMASSLFQSGFDEQASESAAGQALLAAFGRVLKKIDRVAGGSLLRTSTLQGEQAGLYADLIFRQLHMLMQYADQAIAASASTTQGNAE